MDASEGQHKHSIADSDSNDEHWLWTHVDRIKRSIHDVLGSGKDHAANRVKRFWPWDDDKPKEEKPAPETSKGFDLFGWKTDDEPTPKPAHIEQRGEQEDESIQNAIEEEEDVDNEANDGSGSNPIDETTDSFDSKLERFCKNTFHGMIKFNHSQNRELKSLFNLFSVRLKFKVAGVWSPDFEDSNAFQRKGQEVARKLEQLYEREKPSSNRIHANVIQIR